MQPVPQKKKGDPSAHPTMEFPPRIVSDGLNRIRRTKEYEVAKARLMAETRERHSKERWTASFFGRIWVQVVIEWEVRAQLAKMFPPSSLYVIRRAR